MKQSSHIESVAAKIPRIQAARKVAMTQQKAAEASLKSAKSKLAALDKEQAVAKAELESLAEQE